MRHPFPFVRTLLVAALLAPAGVTAQGKTFLRPADVNALPSKPADAHIPYGTDSLQWGELRLPKGKGPFPLAIVIHGGCFVHAYAAANNAAPLADALRDEGVATWNVEYRRRDDPGGAWPGTFLDIGAAADKLRDVAKSYPLDLERVVAIGHSAGGHMALLLASRHRMPADGPLYRKDPLRITGVVSLAGWGDMRDFDSYDNPCGPGTVAAVLGDTFEAHPERWKASSPSSYLPLGVPQVMIAGEFDRIMPRAALDRWAAAARGAGDRVDVVVVPGASHHEVMSPRSVTWPAVRDAVLSLLNLKK